MSVLRNVRWFQTGAQPRMVANISKHDTQHFWNIRLKLDCFKLLIRTSVRN